MVKKIVLVIILNIILHLSFTSNTLAATIFEDNFGDSSINPIYQLSHYVAEDSGSFAPITHSEPFVATTLLNNKINIAGQISINTLPLDDTVVGWLGKSVYITQNIDSLDSLNTEIEVSFPQSEQLVHATLFIEFDSDNRILIEAINAGHLGEITHLVLDENNNPKCIGSVISPCSHTPYEIFKQEPIVLNLHFDKKNQKVVGYVDGSEFFNETFNGTASNSVRIGFAASGFSRGDIINVNFDNFRVYTSEETILSVPYLSQSDPNWGNDEYDFASRWYSDNPSMARWACALTSANMVMQFHGHDVIDPGSLNSWLKSQPDGFNPSGGVMWNTIGRYTKQNNENGKKTLEFQYLSIPPTEENIRAEIESGLPPILKLANRFGGNHFVVATGIEGDEILINDPGKEDNRTLTDATEYWGQVLHIGRYTPTNSDLSYIVSTVNEMYDLELYQDGNKIADEIHEGAIVEATGNRDSVLANPLDAIYYAKPADGEYELRVYNSGLFELNSYLYDVDGNDNQNVVYGLNTNDEDYTNLIILFDQDNSSESEILLTTNFDKLIEDLNYIKEMNKFHKVGVYRSTLNLLTNAKKMHEQENYFTSKILLKVALERLIIATPEHVDEEYSSYLQQEISFLMNEH